MKYFHSVFRSICHRIWSVPFIFLLISCGGGGEGSSFLPVGTNTSGYTSSDTNAVAPNSSTQESSIGAANAFLAGGTLILRIGGSNPGVDQDVLNVGGSAQLGGTLLIEFEDGFQPIAGQTFAVIKAAGGILGGFISVSSNRNISLKTSQDAVNFYVTIN